MVSEVLGCSSESTTSPQRTLKGRTKLQRAGFPAIRASFSVQRNTIGGRSVWFGDNHDLQRLYGPICLWYKMFRPARQYSLPRLPAPECVSSGRLGRQRQFFSNSNFYWRLHAIENALYLRT
jgi:hypothetical protein